MINLVQTYAIHDSDPDRRGATRINRNDARSWNERGYGIFQTVNSFWLDRKKTSIRGVNAWFVECDGGDKASMLAKIKSGPTPTMVVESKNGFHVYWACLDQDLDKTISLWKAIVEHRLIPFYKGDVKAKDLSRVLRVPGFLHQKDPASPFLVKKLWDQKIGYTSDEMIKLFKDPKANARAKKRFDAGVRAVPMDGSFWSNVWGLDCEYALDKLSGTPHVGLETFEFIPNNSGTKQILVNGKSSSSWIDVDRRIGSYDSGGPTIAQWLNWYHKDYTKVVKIIEEVFPECASQQLTLI